MSESNGRPSAYKAVALPTELIQHNKRQNRTCVESECMGRNFISPYTTQLPIADPIANYPIPGLVLTNTRILNVPRPHSRNYAFNHRSFHHI